MSKAGWETKRFDEFCTLQRGFDLPTQDRKAGKFPLVSSSGISDTHDEAPVLAPGVVTGRSGSIGNVFYIEDNFWPLNTTLYIRDFHGNSPRFVYYLLIAFDLKKYAGGTGVPTLNRNDVHSVQILVPNTLKEQNRIVAILDTAFDHITTARANCEANLLNARAIFESHLQAVFTQRGDGWDLKRLDDVCDLITCGVAAKPNYVDVGVPFLSAKNVKRGEIVWSGYNSVSKQTYAELTKNNKPLRGDVLYTRVGSYGEAAVVEEDIEFSVFVSLTLIKPKKNLLNNYYLKYYLNSSEIKQLAKRSISSSGVGNLNVGSVREFPICLPSLINQASIVTKLEQISKETQRLESLYQRKLQALDDLKKSLLHQVFNGML